MGKFNTKSMTIGVRLTYDAIETLDAFIAEQAQKTSTATGLPAKPLGRAEALRMLAMATLEARRTKPHKPNEPEVKARKPSKKEKPAR